MIRLNIHKRLKAPGSDMNLHIDLNIVQGELVTLYGDSGVGKTSTLRMLAGLLDPDLGEINVNDSLWFDSEKNINVKPQQRRIGFVFQDYALFPHMTVRENLEFALQKGDDKAIISDVIAIIELENLQDQKPHLLSGGQQQRVALARALVQKPDILLLDEPLSALDFKIRSKLQDYILKAHKKYNLTTVLISHDISEIFKLSDKVFVLENGSIAKQGNPSEVFIEKDISDGIQLAGLVIGINGLDITLSVASKVIKITVSKNETDKIKVGDNVILTSEIIRPKLHKIEQ